MPSFHAATQVRFAPPPPGRITWDEVTGRIADQLRDAVTADDRVCDPALSADATGHSVLIETTVTADDRVAARWVHLLAIHTALQAADYTGWFVLAQDAPVVTSPAAVS